MLLEMHVNVILCTSYQDYIHNILFNKSHWIWVSLLVQTIYLSDVTCMLDYRLPKFPYSLGNVCKCYFVCLIPGLDWCWMASMIILALVANFFGNSLFQGWVKQEFKKKEKKKTFQIFWVISYNCTGANYKTYNATCSTF